MGLGKRLEAAGVVRKSTFYVLVIGKDVKKLAEAKFKNPDQKTIRKSLRALMKDLRQLEASVLEIVASVGSSNIIEYHRAVVTCAEAHLMALDNVGAETDLADTWSSLYLAMRGWCERMKAVDLQADSKGGDATKALDLLWRYPGGMATEDSPSPVASPGQTTTSAEFLSDYYISLRLGQIEERPLLRRPRIPLGPYLIELAQMYEIGAVLGAARPDCAEPLVKLCVGRLDDDNRQTLLGQAAFHMSKITGAQGTAPSKYIDLVMDLFYSNVPPAGRLEFIFKNRKTEKRREDAVTEMRILFPWGIAFGCTFPDETKTFYEEAHSGTAGTASFDDWQKIILNMAAAFVTTYHPEQLGELRLVVVPD